MRAEQTLHVQRIGNRRPAGRVVEDAPGIDALRRLDQALGQGGEAVTAICEVVDARRTVQAVITKPCPAAWPGRFGKECRVGGDACDARLL